jgi:primosomal protein N' (replication factor Y)
MVNARRGRYRQLALAQRFGGQHEPAIEAIDLKREGPPRGRFIAPRPCRHREDRAGARRAGAAVPQSPRLRAAHALPRLRLPASNCPNCDAWLVDHRFKRQLVCHHCGFTTPRPAACPKCSAPDSFVACGPGVERLEEEAAMLFPEHRIMVLSSDLIASIERMREEFRDIEQGRVDIVIGTQLVAKGHHFPKLNLVGVVDADLGLGSGDPRAAERTFQLLHQVIGRAGREESRGMGYLQNHQPEHPVMRR